MKSLFICFCLLLVASCTGEGNKKSQNAQSEKNEVSTDKQVYVKEIDSKPVVTKSEPAKPIVVKSFKCSLEGHDFEVEARGMSDGSDEGYHKIYFKYKGKELLISNTDTLISGFISLDDGPCGKLPLFLSNNKAVLITGVDGRPFGTKMVANLIDFNILKVVDRLELNPGELFYNKKLFVSQLTGRSDHKSGTVMANGKKYVVSEAESNPMFSIEMNNKMKLVKTYSLEQSFEEFAGKDFFKNSLEFKNFIGDEKEKFVYYLMLGAMRVCIYSSGKREYPKEISKWKCIKH